MSGLLGCDSGGPEDAGRAGLCEPFEICGNGVDDDCDPGSSDVCPRSCAHALELDPALGDGLQLVYPIPEQPPVLVQCDMSGGGWTLAVSAPEGGYASVEPVGPTETLSTARHGRLPDAYLDALLVAGAAGSEDNNVRVEVGLSDTFPRWTVSMRVTEPGPAAYQVPWDANGDCSAYEPGPDVADRTDAPGWRLTNGSDGGSTGFFDGETRSTYAGFYANYDTTTDKSCGASQTSGAFWTAQRGRLWIR